MEEALRYTEVTVTESKVVIKRPGRSALVTANILGTKPDDRGLPETVWLDRIVHGADFQSLDWEATGAVSTVLRRRR